MKFRVTLLSAAILSIAAATASAQETTAQSSFVSADKAKPAAAVKKTAVTTDDIQKDVAEALSIIQKNYGGTKTLNYNDIFKTAMDSMLHTLDPHSNYFDAKEFEEFRTDQSSRYYGIGATIGDLSDPAGNVKATYIKATFDQAPANLAGLRYGDKILEVNGTSMAGKPFTEVRDFLRGKKGTTAKLVIERLGTGKRETIEIIRDAVPQPSIRESYMIRPGIGYLKMDGGFNQTTYAEFVADMRDLKAQGMQQLIIDLRDNGGGLVREAYRVANTFLSEGQTVFSQRGRIEGVSEKYEAENPTPDRSPVVVLVNRGTASASEILSGALQDHDRALIVGEGTFGKGLVQNPFLLDYGSMLLLTIAKYETPSGRLIQRDYSNGDLYNYYTDGGSFRTADTIDKPVGSATHTDTGRPVYGGGGITPDVFIKPQTITIERNRTEVKMLNPIFGFSLNLAAGKVKGFEALKVDKPITFGHDLKASDYPITPALFDAYKRYAAQNYKITPAQSDEEKEFIERMLRTELITANYGAETSYQVFNDYDNQLQKAIDSLPQAKQLSLDAMKARAAVVK